MMSDRTTDIELRRIVPALGVAQIISWGTLFYAIAVLGSAMREELKTNDVILFGSFTCGLFVSGIVSPWVGRQTDARGGRAVLAGGSLLGALACVTLALASGPLTLLTGWVLAGIASAACLYDPAFATLHRISGVSYRRAVTALTLFGGFASTVFWPLSQYLLDSVGWRAAFGVYAGLHAAVCLPLHAVFVPRDEPRVTPLESPPPRDPTHPPARSAFVRVHAAHSRIVRRDARVRASGAQPQFIAKAIAPLALTLVFAVDASRNVSLWTLVACGALALYAYQRAVSAARAVASKPLQ